MIITAVAIQHNFKTTDTKTVQTIGKKSSFIVRLKKNEVKLSVTFLNNSGTRVQNLIFS